MHQPTAVSLEAVQAMRAGIAHCFQVTHTGLDEPYRGAAKFHGRYLQDSADCFDTIQAVFTEQHFTPFVRREADQRLVIIAEPITFEATESDWRINAVLFMLTILTTLLTGAFLSDIETTWDVLQLWRGLPYSLSILLILGAHEMGHYFAARYHKTAVTLPYFIPFLPLIGTMGAVIRMKAPIKNKRVLLDIGAAGPLAGLVFAIPILLYGLYTSELVPVIYNMPLEGNSILYYAAKFAIFGRFLPDATYDVSLNQVAWAGWVGLLVTALNLLPVGQLDGGHITYALWGVKSNQFYLPVMVALAALSIISLVTGGLLTWVFWLVLLFLFGRMRAEPLDDVTPLDKRRKAIAVLCLVVFVLVFVPLPLYVLVQ